MSNLEERLEKLEAHDEIRSCLTRYCRALDWVDEDLLKKTRSDLIIVEKKNINLLPKKIKGLSKTRRAKCSSA